MFLMFRHEFESSLGISIICDDFCDDSVFHGSTPKSFTFVLKSTMNTRKWYLKVNNHPLIGFLVLQGILLHNLFRNQNFPRYSIFQLQITFQSYSAQMNLFAANFFDNIILQTSQNSHDNEIEIMKNCVRTK